jgi:hypothetical protein
MQHQVGAGGVIGDISDWIGAQAAKNPMLTGAGLAIGANLLKPLIGKGLGALFGGGEAAAAAGAGGAAAGGGGAGGAGALAAGGLGAAGFAAGGALLGSTLLAAGFFKGPLVSRGFRDDVDLTQREARELAARAKAAETAAPAARSPGMQAAYEAEERRLRVERARRAGVDVDDFGGGLAEWLGAAAAPGIAAALGGTKTAGKQAAGSFATAAEQRFDAIKERFIPTAHPPSGGGAADPQARALIAELVKAGASLQLAQQTAEQLLKSGPSTARCASSATASIGASSISSTRPTR